MVKKLIVCHPTGNANVRAAVKGFAHSGLLSEFHTTVAAFPGTVLEKLGRITIFSEIQKRSFESILEPYTKLWPWLEVGRMLAVKMGFRNLISHEIGMFCVDSVYKSLDKRVAKILVEGSKNSIDAVYAYEDCAAFSFMEAKKRNMKCFYDLPIGHWRSIRALLLPEMELHPEWASTITGFKDSEVKLARKDQELQLADMIIVASSFTKQTLKDYQNSLAPIKIIPYGFPPVINKREYIPLIKRPLKLLFVGGLSQRKGIANLFEAVDKIGNRVELTIVGHKPLQNCEALNKALIGHKWIPSLPHDQILRLMQEHDILVLPSLFEGFGLVITEAMSQGTPVITTERTAGPDFINHGENGWLVEAGKTNDLVKMIEQLLENPELMKQAGLCALETARQRPWEVYAEELMQVMLSKE